MIKKKIISILTCAFLLFAAAPSAFAEEANIAPSDETAIEQPSAEENTESGSVENENKGDEDSQNPVPDEPGEDPNPPASLEKPVITISIESSCLVIKWNKVEGALKYIVYKKNGSSWEILKECAENELTYKDYNVSNNNGYVYKIEAINDEEQIESDETRKYYYMDKSDVRKVINNRNGSYQVEVKGISGASAYEIQVSKYENFKTVLLDKQVTAADGKISGGLSTYGHYYFRARTVKKVNGYTDYSVWGKAIETNLINMPYYNQKKRYPTGCEPVSAVMAMKYLGSSVSYEKYITKYLKKGKYPTRTNPNKAFMGNPKSRSAWGCYQTPIINATKKATKKVKAKKSYEKSVAALTQKYIDYSKPVIIWGTVNMAPVKRTIKLRCGVYWKSPNHCLLLTGYDSEYYYFNDPLRAKNTRYSKSTVEKIFAKKDKRAVIFYK